MITIKDLKEFIKDLPDEMEVCSRDTKWNREDSRVYKYKEYDEYNDIEKYILVVE